jgi:hypothetical protein
LPPADQLVSTGLPWYDAVMGGARVHEVYGLLGPATASANVAGVDLHGQNLVIAGGLFVNNGFVADSTPNPGSVIVDYGALYKGAGTNFVNVITQNGGKVQAGNSPGSMGFGRFVFGPGGVNNYVFAIDDATGTAGPSPDAFGHVSGWGLVKAVKAQFGTTTTSGDFLWTATPTGKLTVAIDTLINPTTVGTDVPGMMDHFDPNSAHSWPAVQWAGTYSGPTDAAVLDAATSFDNSGFVNPVAGAFGWNLDPAGQSLSLTYTPTPVPEPGTLTLMGAAAAASWWWRRPLGISHSECLTAAAGRCRLSDAPASPRAPDPIQIAARTLPPFAPTARRPLGSRGRGEPSRELSASAPSRAGRTRRRHVDRCSRRPRPDVDRPGHRLEHGGKLVSGHGAELNQRGRQLRRRHAVHRQHFGQRPCPDAEFQQLVGELRPHV